LLGIARNRAIDRLRAESRRPRAVHAWTDDPTRTTRSTCSTGLAGRDGPAEDDPVIEVDRRWTRSLVRTTLAEMPPDERQVVVLAYDHALSQSEIADRLGMPIGTVKSRTRRALARLRSRLADVPDLRPGDRAEASVARPAELDR
jgi:RNA polymerase sigma-70 factor (ECF subfamily)